jgi:hypothetical protein
VNARDEEARAREVSLTVWLSTAHRAFLDRRKTAGGFETTSEALRAILATAIAAEIPQPKGQ